MAEPSDCDVKTEEFNDFDLEAIQQFSSDDVISERNSGDDMEVENNEDYCITERAEEKS